MQDLISLMPYHAVFGFLIPLLVGVLQVCVQGTSKSLLETHSRPMWAFLVAIFIYCFSFAAEIRSKLRHTSYSQFFNTLAIISGSLSAVSMILPGSTGNIIFIPWALVCVIVVAYVHAYNWLYQKVCGIWDKFRGNKLMEQPPVTSPMEQV